MKIIYQIEDFILHDDKIEDNAVPSIGDMIYFDEVFFVREVVWYPKDRIIRIFLNDEPLAKVKVAEHKGSVVNLQEVRKIKDIADKALKESSSLRKEIFSIREYLKSTSRTAVKHDTR